MGPYLPDRESVRVSALRGIREALPARVRRPVERQALLFLLGKHVGRESGQSQM